DKNIIVIDNKYEKDAIIFSIKKLNQMTDLPLSFTFKELTKVKNHDNIQLIEDLYKDGILQRTETGKYLLLYDELYNLTGEERELINIPSTPAKLSIELDIKGFVTSSSFEFVPKIHSTDYGNLNRIGSRKGALIELPTKE